MPEPILAARQTVPYRLIAAGLAAAGQITPEFLLRREPASLIKAAKASPSPAAIQGLLELTNAIARDSDLTMFGRIATRFDFIRLLSNAEMVGKLHQENPGLAARAVPAPIFIMGLPRSGTTFLHALMAEDPENLVPRNWQTIFPAPRPPGFHPRAGKHARIVDHELKFFAGIAPGFSEAHPISADSPQECSEITAAVFQSLRFDTTFRVPAYRDWIDRHGHDEAFGFHKKFLQVLQAGLPISRWVLKCPDHIFSVDSILKTYPDARFVIVHRDPIKVFGSVAHLTEVLRRPFVKNVDPVELGVQVTERWIAGAQRLVAFDQRTDVPAARKFHIQYEDLVADPLTAIERIYGFFAMDVSAPARDAISHLLNAKPRGGYTGVRRYNLGRFNINAERLGPKFADYLEYFGIPPRHAG